MLQPQDLKYFFILCIQAGILSCFFLLKKALMIFGFFLEVFFLLSHCIRPYQHALQFMKIRLKKRMSKLHFYLRKGIRTNWASFVFIWHLYGNHFTSNSNLCLKQLVWGLSLNKMCFCDMQQGRVAIKVQIEKVSLLNCPVYKHNTDS